MANKARPITPGASPPGRKAQAARLPARTTDLTARHEETTPDRRIGTSINSVAIRASIQNSCYACHSGQEVACQLQLKPN